MNKTLIAYHASCNDGQTAGFVAWKFTGRNAATVAVNYDLHKKSFTELVNYLSKPLQTDDGSALDLSEYTLYVVDFCFPYETLVLLGGVFEQVTVLDHHKTSQDDLNAKPPVVISRGNLHTYIIAPNVTVYFNMEESGALMTWRYFAGSKAPVADFVRYASDRDLWKFVDPNTRPFVSGMGLHRTATWEQLETVYDNPIAVIASGRVIEAVRDGRVESTLSKPPRMLTAIVEDQTFEVGVYNAPADIASDLLHTYLTRNPVKKNAVGMAYIIGSDDTVYCSMRSGNETDCSVIAKVLGGGGHAQACGFTVPLKRFIEMLDSGSLTGMYPNPKKKWGYRRYGSPPMKGYTLLADGSPIAYLGDGDEVGEIAESIVSTHNNTL